MHPLDIEAETAAQELTKETCDRREIKSLLEKSLRHRKPEREALKPDELLARYPYLKVPEMVRNKCQYKQALYD